MADPVVRALVFYWRNKLAVEVNRVRVKFMMGRTALYGAQGLAAYSKGAASIQIVASGFQPVSGSAISNDIERILNQDDIDCAWISGGKHFRQKLAVIDLEQDSDSQTGVVTESITLEGKRPKITG